MVDKKIEQIRQQLNQMMISENVDKEKILLKSQELDLLILKFMEANMFEHHDYKVLAIDRLLKLADKKMCLVNVKARRVG